MEHDVLNFETWENDQSQSISVAITIARQISNMTTFKTKVIKETLDICDEYFTIRMEIYPDTRSRELQDFWRKHVYLQITVPDTGDIMIGAFVDDTPIRITPNKQNVKLEFIKLISDRLHNIMTKLWSKK